MFYVEEMIIVFVYLMYDYFGVQWYHLYNKGVASNYCFLYFIIHSNVNQDDY